MVVDARKGIGPGDEDVARLIGEFKRQDAPVILVSNKSERYFFLVVSTGLDRRSDFSVHFTLLFFA